jgi:tryptophan synthase alpha chain
MYNQTINQPIRAKLPIMAHLVLGYPTLAESLRTAAAYMAAGVEILELQIPFSHPTADGPVITSACQEATKQGVTVRDCIEAIEALRIQHPSQEIIVMSYLNRIYTFGFQAFVDKMKAIGIQYLIIPDLPADAAQSFIPPHSGLKIVPVLAANTSEARLNKLLDHGFDFFYLMSDFKITGSGFSLHPNLKAIIDKIKGHNPAIVPRIGIGFGISTPEQALLITGEADLAIIGSALIQAQQAGKLEEYLESLQLAFKTP